jgi:glycosyltransferase involved in cell wall biosynthesis/GT2 family glycosyltransferase
MVPGLDLGTYVHSSAHWLLDPNAGLPEGPSIGRCGSNLTISFLSLNRVSLSVKLLRSIADELPGFLGEVLVVDNGSQRDEIDQLRSVLAEQPYRTRLVDLGSNFGVAGGRNRTIPHVKSEWLMCLDNDIYFVSNPLGSIQADLARLGCHFMSLPLLNPDRSTAFARGGHLYVDCTRGELHVGGGSALVGGSVTAMSSDPGFLSTFLFGGACVFRVATFKSMGGYDENMFVGFEDIDFSIRLFRGGYKIGSSGVTALVHDHPPPATTGDLVYERERFSRGVLLQSARYLESKFGFTVWTHGTDDWLASREADLGIRGPGSGDDRTSSLDIGAAPMIAVGAKPKIALVLDVEDWAFANIAKQVMRHLGSEFEFLTLPMSLLDNINQCFVLADKCDLTHFFWREHLTLIGDGYSRSCGDRLGLSYDSLEERFIRGRRISTAVYDHLHLDAQSLEYRAWLYHKWVKGYSVGSRRLFDIYSGIAGFPHPRAILSDGVDTVQFKPINLERLREVGRRDLIVGWVGNSKWAADLEDFKGVHTILRPAIEELRAEGVRIQPYFADRQERFIPHAKMSDYYSKIDVYVCTSKIEGTPNPVLEAMACGVPVISTDVGIVREALGGVADECILRERSVAALKEKLREVVRSPELLVAHSIAGTKNIGAWDWESKAKAFGPYFSALC